jgi:hypothetical protein
MKRYLFTFFALLVMTVLWSNNLNAQTKEYKSKTGKFSFKYFEDWSIEESD